MFVTRMSLPRRTFLRGMGVTVALPLLEAMVPALTAAAQTVARPVRRFGAIYVPHGKMLTQWTPRTSGAGFEFTPILKPLEPFRNYLTVVSGLSAGPTVQNGGHAVAPASYLTGNIQPKQTEGSALDRVVERARQSAVREIIAILRSRTGKDFGDDPRRWIEGLSTEGMARIGWISPKPAG